MPNVFAQDETFFTLHYESENGIFDYTLEPGSEKEISVVLENPSNFIITNTMMVYDASSMDNGGTISFSPDNMVRDGVSKWFNFVSDEVTLHSGDYTDFKIMVSVPKGTPPGDYVAIFAVYAKGNEINNTSDFSVIANNSKTVDMVIRVEGDKVYDMTFGEKANVLPDGENSILIKIPIQNSSNYYDFPNMHLEIHDEKGNLVLEKVEQLDIVYASSKINYVFPIDKSQLPNGKYTLLSNMEFGEKDNYQSIEKEFLLEILNKEIDIMPSTENVIDPSLTAVKEDTNKDEKRNSTVLISIVILAIILLALITFLVLRKRMQHVKMDEHGNVAKNN